MGRIILGVKAGSISGIFYGIVTATLVYLTYSISKEEVLSEIVRYLESISEYQITAQEYYDSLIIIAPVASFILGIIVGLLFGIIYSLFYSKIPGKKYFNKSIFFGIILWLILYIFGIYMPLWLPFEYNMLVALISSFILSFLIGFFYNRLNIEPKE